MTSLTKCARCGKKPTVLSNSDRGAWKSVGDVPVPLEGRALTGKGGVACSMAPSVPTDWDAKFATSLRAEGAHESNRTAQQRGSAQPTRGKEPLGQPVKPQSSVFSRLTDASGYTGAHKHRFDSDGQGRGKEGRDCISKGNGHLPPSAAILTDKGYPVAAPCQAPLASLTDEVAYMDTDGDEICFSPQRSGQVDAVQLAYTNADGGEVQFSRSPAPRVDYFVNEVLMISSLTVLKITGCTLLLEGTVVGDQEEVEGTATRTSSVSRGQEHILRRVLDLYRSKADVQDCTMPSGGLMVPPSESPAKSPRGSSSPYQRRPPSPRPSPKGAPQASPERCANKPSPKVSPKVSSGLQGASTDGSAIEDVFITYCGGKPSMDGRSFTKLCKDCKLVDKKFATTDADLLFSKVKPKGQRGLALSEFMYALELLAQKKGVNASGVLASVAASGGPVLNATVPESVRFFDDKSTYTGVHVNGGPERVAKGIGTTTQLAAASMQQNQ